MSVLKINRKKKKEEVSTKQGQRGGLLGKRQQGEHDDVFSKFTQVEGCIVREKCSRQAGRRARA